jgi:hypothetical protein
VDLILWHHMVTGDIDLAALAAQTTTAMRSWVIQPMLEGTANLTLSVSVLLPSQVCVAASVTAPSDRSTIGQKLAAWTCDQCPLQATSELCDPLTEGGVGFRSSSYASRVQPRRTVAFLSSSSAAAGGIAQRTTAVEGRADRQAAVEAPSGQAAVVVGALAGGASVANGWLYVVDRVLLPTGLRLGRAN